MSHMRAGFFIAGIHHLCYNRSWFIRETLMQSLSDFTLEFLCLIFVVSCPIFVDKCKSNYRCWGTPPAKPG